MRLRKVESSGRYEIVADHIVWNFTREQLEERINNLHADLALYQKHLADIDAGLVVSDAQSG